MTDLPDARPLLDTALATAGATLAAVRPDQLDGSTPCPEFTVRELAAHLVDVALRIGDIGRGEPVFDGFVPVRPGSIDVVEGDAWASAYEAAAAEAATSWRDDDSLTRMVALPWATLPGAIQLLTYVNELSVHTWDLAAATGQSPDFDDEVLQVALDAITFGMPADHRTEQVPFGPVVDVPADAPLIDRLVGWNGRNPALAAA